MLHPRRGSVVALLSRLLRSLVMAIGAEFGSKGLIVPVNGVNHVEMSLLW